MEILTQQEAERASHEAGYGQGRPLLYTSHEALRVRDKRRMVLIREARSVLLDVERVRKRLDAEIAVDNQDMIDGRKA